MEKELKIRVREDLCIETDILKNARFIDCGASKSTFVIGETCYKIPIGYELLDSNSFTKTLKLSGTPGSGTFSPVTIDSYVFTLPTTSSDFTVSIS